MKNIFEVWKRDMIPKKHVTVAIILALILGYMYGSGALIKEAETKAVVDSRLDVQAGDKIRLICEPEELNPLCFVQGWVRKGKSSDYSIEWETGSFTKHDGKILGEESIQHASGDYFLHNISVSTIEETQVW